MLCLLFLLVNHLKSRIITLENQNEGLMEVMKMIRGNLVSSDKEQKQVKESISSLAKNVAQVSNVVHTIQSKPLSHSVHNIHVAEKHNITLEVEDLSSVQGNIANTWTAESEEGDDETEENTQPIGEDNDLEVVQIDWPVDENIEIRKIVAEDSQEYDMLNASRIEMEMRQNPPIFMNSTDASEIQKMFFMMSMGNGIPMSNIIFENHRVYESQLGGQYEREYEILPDTFHDPEVEPLMEPVEDPEVEPLVESPLPELVEIEDKEGEPNAYRPDTIDLYQLDGLDLNARISELITEITSAVVAEEETEPAVVAEEETRAIEIEPTEKEEKTMDFSKMDLRSLRSLVSTQGKATHEKVSKMKKAELIRILTSSTE